MILVDDRIGSIELIPTFQQLVPILCSSKKYQHDPSLIPHITSARLLCGDVCFDGLGPKGTSSIGIERKRLKDMLNSIRSGRYSGHQLPEMLNFYDQSYLFIEGLYRCGEDGYLEFLHTSASSCSPTLGGRWLVVRLGNQAIRYTELDHFLCTIQSHTSVKIRNTANDRDTCSQIISLYIHSQEPYEDHHSHQSLHVPQTLATIGKAGLVRKWAACIDGIGWEKSGQAALKFRTGWDLANANIEDWATIKPGIGKVLAKSAYEQIRGMRKEKGEL